jgi:hypothetical protein
METYSARAAALVEVTDSVTCRTPSMASSTANASVINRLARTGTALLRRHVHGTNEALVPGLAHRFAAHPDHAPPVHHG